MQPYRAERRHPGIRLLALIFVFVAGMARAETVTLTSGEHDGFTRIVVDLSEPSPWQMGRMPDGYVLQLARGGIRFDLTEVFDNIPRTRLAAIWADPETGDLRLGIGCACHAMPFEFRKNVIVIDIKDGPPPPGSSFEQSLEGRAMPKLAASQARKPKSRPDQMPPGFSWTRMRTAPATKTVSLPAADLEGMRSSLLEQLSRGASQGLVNLTLPTAPPSDATREILPDHTDGQVKSGFGPKSGGPKPGLTATTPLDPEAALTPEGHVCIEDERLDITGWADARPFPDQISDARSALLGEFDRPDPEAVGRLVRLQVHFGFGVEARATLRALPVTTPDAAIWDTMARIVDGAPVPPDNPFAGQEDCETAAAFWSVLARPDLRASDRPDLQAVLRTFSGLPLPLRRSLGPGLAERFLAIDDTTSARAIRDAMLRAPGNPGAAAQLADAQLDMATGHEEKAVAKIEAVSRDAGPMLPQAMIDLVDARLSQGAEIDPGTLQAIEALGAEHGAGPLGPDLRRAEGLARASGGDYAGAFALSAEGNPDFDAELWPMLADDGADEVLLAIAVRNPAEVPQTARGTAATIARRLIDLGFPDAGLAWMPQTDGDTDQILLAARAELMRRDARAALRLMAGQVGTEADRLRAEAQAQLGDIRAAAAAFAAAGDTEAADRALWEAQDWAAVAAAGADPVRSAAAALALPSAEVPPLLPTGLGDAPITLPLQPTPLARGRALIDDSAAARAAVLSLLDAVPRPDIAQP